MDNNIADNDSLVKRMLMKPSGVVQISSDAVSLLQRKCFNVLLINAYRELDKEETHKIKIADIRYALNDHDIDKIKSSLIRLASTVVEMNTLQSRDKTIWAISSLLADAEIREDYLFYSYGPLLRTKLQNPAIYARVNLAIQRNFRTKYAMVLYELACDHFIAAKGHGQTPFIALDNLRKLMGCANDTIYKQYRFLNERVIKKAIREINEKSDLHIEVKHKKERQAVIAVQFLITPNEHKSGMTSELYAPKQAEIPLSPGGILHERLTKEYFMNAKQAMDIIERYPQQYIEEKLIIAAKLALKYASMGKEVNLAALTHAAITHDYSYGSTVLLENHESTAIPDLKEGMRIEIEDGTVHAVDAGEVIRIGRGVIPKATIIRKLKAGRYKIVTADDAAEYNDHGL
ncbi:MAG TPA: replication initiation protein [Syntrophales bacterium]|nr:replication initiation protein [Syntrophales bacterium]